VLGERTVAEQRFNAVMEVLRDGLTVVEVAGRYGVSRQAVHGWLRRWQAGGLDALADRSHRPSYCPHQMPAQVEARLCELRRRHPDWGQRRLAHELVRQGIDPPPGLTSIYRALLRNGLIEPRARRRRKAAWRRWERDQPMQLWQMDVMGGVWRRRPPCPGLLVVAGARQPGRVHAGTIGITQATLPIPAVATALLRPAP
jgi:transposase-like protein